MNHKRYIQALALLITIVGTGFPAPSTTIAAEPPCPPGPTGNGQVNNLNVDCSSINLTIDISDKEILQGTSTTGNIYGWAGDLSATISGQGFGFDSNCINTNLSGRFTSFEVFNCSGDCKTATINVSDSCENIGSNIVLGFHPNSSGPVLGDTTPGPVPGYYYTDISVACTFVGAEAILPDYRDHICMGIGEGQNWGVCKEKGWCDGWCVLIKYTGIPGSNPYPEPAYYVDLVAYPNTDIYPDYCNCNSQ